MPRFPSREVHFTELGVADGAAPGLLFDHLVFVRRAMERAGPPEVTSPAVLVDDRDDPLRVSPDELVDLLMDHVGRSPWATTYSHFTT